VDEGRRVAGVVTAGDLTPGTALVVGIIGGVK
jgi:hypothetical protein